MVIWIFAAQNWKPYYTRGSMLGERTISYAVCQMLPWFNLLPSYSKKHCPIANVEGLFANQLPFISGIRMSVSILFFASGSKLSWASVASLFYLICYIPPTPPVHKCYTLTKTPQCCKWIKRKEGVGVGEPTASWIFLSDIYFCSCWKYLYHLFSWFMVSRSLLTA